MQVRKVSFSRQATTFYFDAAFSQLKKIVPQKTSVLVTDEHVFAAHKKLFNGWHCILIKSGEEYKVQATIDSMIEQLIAMHADRTWTLIGIGGGVVTDMTGYLASVFLRGIAFGFVPTTVLGMVDASIGGKNGIDVGLYKNMIGTIIANSIAAVPPVAHLARLRNLAPGNRMRAMDAPPFKSEGNSRLPHPRLFSTLACRDDKGEAQSNGNGSLPLIRQLD